MPQYTPIPLATKSDEGRSKASSAERLVNWYVSPGAQGDPTLLPRPGLLSWKSGIGDGPIRGMSVMNEYIFVVSGEELYTINNAKTTTLIGSIPGQGPVRMTNNRTHLLISANNTLYVADETGVIFDHAINANGVGYIDGYGILSESQTEQWRITNLDDFTTISGADFTSADREVDYATGVGIKDGYVFIFGEYTTEVYQNTGNASFPFERVQVISQGTVAPGSIAKYKTSFFFVGQDNRVYEMQGYNPQRISSERVERFLEALGGVEAAEAFIFTQAGHTWYVLNFATGSWIYDLNTQLWSEWLTHGDTRWIAHTHVYFHGQNIVGDYQSGELYELDLDTYDDNGTTIRWEAIIPPIEANGSPMFVDELIVKMQTGVGLVSGQGSAPVIMLGWSDDDGNTWHEETPQSIGALGNYETEVKFRRLGMIRRRRHFRLAVTDPIFPVITGLRALASGAEI